MPVSAMMDDEQATSTTNSPQTQPLPSELPSAPQDVVDCAADQSESNELDTVLNAQVNGEEIGNGHQLPTEPDGLDAEDGLGQEDTTLKDEQGWDQIMTEEVDSVEPTTDAIADASTISEHPQDASSIAVDPELSANHTQTHTSNAQSAPVGSPIQFSSPLVGSTPMNTTTSAAQPYPTLLETRGIGPVAPLSQSRLDALPIGPGLAPLRNHQAHAINHLPPFPGQHAPPVQHPYPPQTPVRPQHIALQPLMPLISAHSTHSTPSKPDRQESGGTDFKGLKLISDPPDLQQWREKLFNVEDTIVLSEEE